MSWHCKKCTFLNPLSLNTNCQRCLSPRSSKFKDLNDIGDDGHLGSSFGFGSLPSRPWKGKIWYPVDGNRSYAEFSEFRGVEASGKAVSRKAAVLTSIKILSYNVWFADVELHQRMKAISDLIQLHSPDVINFQEITPEIYDIFRRSGWWKVYHCSVSTDEADSSLYFCMQLSKLRVKSFSYLPFTNSRMGRELCITEVVIEGKNPLIIASSHLESPLPGPLIHNKSTKERVVQAKEAIDVLKKNNNVIFCGDLNWIDEFDGKFPMPDGWVDAWEQLRPGENGWTYDTKSNQMLSANWQVQSRLDRFVCNLHDFKISEIKMIGNEAIPGLLWMKEKWVMGRLRRWELPVFPSDHYGLLLTIGDQ